MRFRATITGGAAVEHAVFVDGARVDAEVSGDRLDGVARVAPDAYGEPVSEWVAPYGPLVVVAVRDAEGAVAGAVGTASDSPL